MKHWFSLLWQQRNTVIALPIICSLFFNSCASSVKTKDHRPGHWEKSHSNSYLWRRVKDNPPVFYPKNLPQGYAVNSNTGEWIVDANDRSSFFVPNQTIDGLTPKMWRTEAKKAVDLLEEYQEPKKDTKEVIGTITTVIVVGGVIIAYLLFVAPYSDDDQW
jgi:hypothetical protein